MASGAVPVRCLRCAAAVSGLSADFYVAVMHRCQPLVRACEGNLIDAQASRPAMPNFQSFRRSKQTESDAVNAGLDWYLGTHNPGGEVLNVAGQT